MKILSLSDFEEECNRVQKSCYLLSSENLPKRQNENFDFELKFDKINFASCQESIRFIGDNCSITLRNIKEIRVLENDFCLGMVFVVVCLPINYKSKNTYFTFIAQ